MNVQSTAGQPGDTLGFAANTGIMFSNHRGRAHKGTEKRQRKLAQKVGFIGRFLEQGEQVCLVTQGLSPMSFMEQYLTGWVIYYIKRSLFVFTDRRIFHVLTDSSYNYRNSIAEIRYADCKLVRQKGGTLVVEYQNKSTEKFYKIAGGERKKIREFLKTVSYEGQQTAARERTFLCPRCTRPLQTGVFQCAACRLEFKSKDEGRKISIIYPGGGYFYARHPLLGAMDAIVEVIIILAVIDALIRLLGGATETTGELVVLLIILALEKVVTIYHANHFLKEFIPRDKEIRPLQV